MRVSTFLLYIYNPCDRSNCNIHTHRLSNTPCHQEMPGRKPVFSKGIDQPVSAQGSVTVQVAVSKHEHEVRQAKKDVLSRDEMKTLPTDPTAYNPHPGDVAVVMTDHSARRQRTVNEREKLVCTIHTGGIKKSSSQFRVLGIVKTSGHNTTDPHTTDCIAVDICGMVSIINNSPFVISVGMSVYAKENPYTATVTERKKVVPGVQVRGRHCETFTPELLGMYMLDVSDMIAEINHTVRTHPWEGNVDERVFVEQGKKIVQDIIHMPDADPPTPLTLYTTLALWAKYWSLVITSGRAAPVVREIYDTAQTQLAGAREWCAGRTGSSRRFLSSDRRRPTHPLAPGGGHGAPGAVQGVDQLNLLCELGDQKCIVVTHIYEWLDAHLIGKAQSTARSGQTLDIYRAKP